MDDKKLTESEWPNKVDELYKQGEDWQTRKEIIINLNYYLGNQWIGWNSSTKSVQALPQADGQERITHNVLQPRVLTKLSKQTKNRIKYDVTPDTNDQNRIEIAKAATKFLHYWWDTEEMDLKTRDIFLNGNVKGYCAAKVYFDGEAGTDITPQEGEPGYEEDMKPIFTGEIRCEIVDPLALSIDPAATTENEIRWWVERKPRDVDYVKMKYGKEVTPDENVDFAPSLNSSDSNRLGVGDSKKNKHMVMVYELWYKPCKKYPKGLKVTATNKELLDMDENAGESPYFLFGDIPIPGSPKYKSFLESMRPIQRGLNVALTMFATNLKKMGATKWLVPLGSNIDEEELNDEISGIIHYNATAGGKVERASGADIPNGFDRIIEYYNRLIDDMSGAREVSQGRLPAGLDTASGLQLMVEQENEKMAVNSQNYERGMKKLLKRVLRLMKRHYTEERLARILGPDDEIELVSFTGSDLSGEEDINVVQGSSLPEMKSAQQDRIMSLWQAGAIVRKDGTPDPDTFLRMLGMGDSTELFEMHQLDENNAKMENKEFEEAMDNPQLAPILEQYMMQQQAYQMAIQETQAAGLTPEQFGYQKPQPIPGMPKVWDSDDHEVHIYQHNLFRKSSVYRKQLTPEMQAMVDTHIAEHDQALMAPIIAQQQQEQAMMQEQADQQKEQQAAQSQEADKAHQRQVEMKQMDHTMNMQREQVKANTALQAASMRGGSG